MYLVVVFVRLELGHLVLPVSVEDVPVLTGETLGDLRTPISIAAARMQHVQVRHTLDQSPVNVSGGGAWPLATI